MATSFLAVTYHKKTFLLQFKMLMEAPCQSESTVNGTQILFPSGKLRLVEVVVIIRDIGLVEATIADDALDR
jgi:hypothetical protein